MKINSYLALSLLSLTCAIYSNNTCTQGVTYYYDNTPEYKKSPAGYLTAFANYYFDFNGYGLTYALGDSGRNMPLKELYAIQTRVIHIRKETNNELAIYQSYNAPYCRSNIYKAAAQLGIATGCIATSFYLCFKMNPGYDSVKDYIATPSIAGLTALGFIPFGINNIVNAHPVIHAHELAHRLRDIDAVIELVNNIINERTEQNQQPQE